MAGIEIMRYDENEWDFREYPDQRNSFRFVCGPVTKKEKQTTMAKEKVERVKLITPVFRGSYPAVFEARKVNQDDANEKAKYSIVMIFQVAETPESKAAGIPVVDLAKRLTADNPAMKEEVAKILLKQLGANWPEEIKKTKGDGGPMYRLPFRNGAGDDCKVPDPKAPGGFTWKPGLGPGTVYVRAASEFKPGVIDGQKKEIMNPQDVYGGAFYRAQIHAYWYDVKGNKGVTFGLDNVQFVRDGEPFGGRQKAEDAFDAIEAPAGAVAAGVSTGDPMAAL